MWQIYSFRYSNDFISRELASVLLTGDKPIELACQFLPIAGKMIFAVDFLFVFRSAVQGMGYPFIPMCSGVAEMALRIGFIYVFFQRVGFAATAYAEVIEKCLRRLIPRTNDK